MIQTFEKFARQLVVSTGITDDKDLIHMHSERILGSFTQFLGLRMVNDLSSEQLEIFKDYVELEGFNWDIKEFLRQEGITENPEEYIQSIMDEFGADYLKNAEEAKSIMNSNRS